VRNGGLRRAMAEPMRGEAIFGGHVGTEATENIAVD
jgi:hypothetical protein